MDFNGHQSQWLNLEHGSPQGSKLSPLLFLIMICDIEEWLQHGTAIGYADDTTCFAIGKTRDEVKDRLEKSADDILEFMRATLLAANPDKTKFVSLGQKKENPIRVGNTFIPESNSETLLGITFNKRLTWKDHLERLVPELKSRIGILKRLSWSLPFNAMKLMVEQVFTSKLRYGLELVTDLPTIRRSCSENFAQPSPNGHENCITYSNNRTSKR